MSLAPYASHAAAGRGRVRSNSTYQGDGALSGSLVPGMWRVTISSPNLGISSKASTPSSLAPRTWESNWTAAAGRNLLIEVIQRGNSKGSQIFTFPLDAAADPTTTRMYAIPATASTGMKDAMTSGLVMSFRTAAASGGLVPLLSNTGTPKIGTTFSVDLSQARPNTTAFLALGFSDTTWLGQPLPLDLGKFGAPTCFLYSSVTLLHVVMTDATGSASLKYEARSGRRELTSVTSRRGMQSWRAALCW